MATEDDHERALRALAREHRDRVIHAARADGFTKNRIHALTGISRVTIDRILKEKPVNEIQTPVIYNGLSDGENAPWTECAQMWRFDKESNGLSVAIVGKADNADTAPLASYAGKTYVLTRYYEEGMNDWFITAKPYTLPHERVPVDKITAVAGGSWSSSATAWVEAAREAGHHAEVVEGETVNEYNSQPVVLVDGSHYVLSKYSDNGTVVHVDYKARKYNGTWTPTP